MDKGHRSFVISFPNAVNEVCNFNEKGIIWCTMPIQQFFIAAALRPCGIHAHVFYAKLNHLERQRLISKFTSFQLICLQALTLKMPGASSQRMLGCVALKVNQLDLHFQEINESITGRDREAHDGDVVADAVLFAGPREDSPTDTIWKTLVVDSHSRIGTRSTQVENEIKFDIKCIKHALHEE
ncbi:hypothetical protein VTN96DRAFT_5674 [Rasamsonia emersonii]